MPVSKKRKLKRRSFGASSSKNEASSSKKITTQKIIIYVISAVMILSLALSFFASSGHTGVQNNPGAQPQTADGNNLLIDPQPPAQPHDQSMGAEEDVGAPASEN